jgi:hypothetical protein
MRLCHAAALALAGWYLIVPPPDCSKRNPKNPHFCASDESQPFDRWAQLALFDSASECLDFSNALASGNFNFEGERASHLKEKAGSDWPAMKKLLSAGVPTRCISADDPRLKVNGQKAPSAEQNPPRQRAAAKKTPAPSPSR